MKFSVRAICFVGMFTAVISVLSVLVIPTPWGVPFTLQTFAVALAGYVLGARYGAASAFLYVLLGLIGVPVYAGMKAGAGVLFGPTGGFLFGFILMAFLCGLAMSVGGKKKIRIVFLVLLSALALAACHIPGILQFWFVMNRMSGAAVYSLMKAAAVASLPYLPKDALSVVCAYFAACAIRAGLGDIRSSFSTKTRPVS